MVAFEVRKYRGTTFLFKDGKPIPSILCWVRPDYYLDFKNAGIRTATWRIPIGWAGPSKFDYTMADKLMEQFLSLDPEILFLPRVRFPGSNRDWWCQSHPEELIRLSNGELGSAHSTASEVWRREATEALVGFIEHMETSSYADHIIGYHVCDGHFHEWFAWDSANFEREVHRLKWVCGPGHGVRDCPTPFPDYSKPMCKAFREWLRVKYSGDVEALRKAWNDKDVDFSTATIPSRLERVWSEDFILRDPSKCMKAIDYDTCFQDVHSDTLLGLCKAAKERVGSRKITGVFYGYLWSGFFRGFYMQHAGHLALSKVLDSPYVDFIASPYDYENRNVDGVNFPQTVPEAIALHGKIHFSEVDLKTFLTDPASKWHHKENWRPQTLQETVEMLKRDYSYAHAMGFGMWWTDLAGKGWYHHEGITQALRKLQEIEERLLESDRSSNREIAVILDEKSLIYERPCQNMMTSLRNVFRQWELAYIGAPFDTYLQSDLIDQELKDYRMYLFLNNVHMTKHEMEVIKECVRRDRKVALWVWAPGLIIDSDLALNHIQDLTEIRVDCENCEARLHVDVVNYDHPITRELPKGSSFGPEISRWHMALFKESGFVEDDPSFTMGPIFYSNDPDVKVLGSLPAAKKPGFVVKELEDWTSIYVSAPMISKAILRNIAKFAGVHVYVESGDLVYANKHFLAVYPRIGGHKVVQLPEPRRITDLWNDELIAEKTDEFEAKMNANTAYMYLLE